MAGEKYVSRAEGKLAGAARAFSFDFRGKTVMDIGSSTGGFTEFALARGAKKVVAIEKGTKQMKVPLRFDPRVELHEKTDIFEVVVAGVGARAGAGAGAVGGKGKDEWTKIETVPEVILADVSFVELSQVLAHAKKFLAGKGTEFW